MKRAMYPGTFDPITKGHIDIIERSAVLFDEVIVAIMQNANKKNLFTELERKEMIEKEVAHLANVQVVVDYGLTVNYAKQHDISMIIRGIRATSDYEYEMQIATANMILEPTIETVFLLSKPEYSFVSSSTVKDIATHHGELSGFVGEYTKQRLIEKLK